MYFTVVTHEQYIRNKETENARSKAYYWSHLDTIRMEQRNRARIIRHKARLLVGRGKIKCVNCGCDNEDVIEVNHILGGGKVELSGSGSQMKFFRNIVNGKRDIEDLDLRCKLCNELHYIERKFGKLPFQVFWNQKILI